jgi:hypothetical protein
MVFWQELVTGLKVEYLAADQNNTQIGCKQPFSKDCFLYTGYSVRHGCTLPSRPIVGFISITFAS